MHSAAVTPIEQKVPLGMGPRSSSVVSGCSADERRIGRLGRGRPAAGATHGTATPSARSPAYTPACCAGRPLEPITPVDGSTLQRYADPGARGRRRATSEFARPRKRVSAAVSPSGKCRGRRPPRPRRDVRIPRPQTRGHPAVRASSKCRSPMPLAARRGIRKRHADNARIDAVSLVVDVPNGHASGRRRPGSEGR
jgi:hypothetical protein